MEDFILVNVLEAETDLDEELPYFLLFQGLFVLHFEVHRQIAIIAILHNNVQSVIFDKGLFILDYKRVDELAHDGCLVESLR